MEPNDAIDNILQNEQQNNELNAMLDDVLSTLTDTMYNPPSVSSTSSASSSPTFTNFPQPSVPNLEGVRIKIVEQPALKGLRFRYICEGRSAGSIPGVHSTPENKTFPTIEIEGYEGKVKVVVSCVTKDEPYRPHPHNLVGKEGCAHGVCLATINGPPMRAVFSNLGIQCVKKKDIKAALEEREKKRIDPFKTSFAHKDQPSSIDLNVVRLCFQAFIPIAGVKKPFPIPPVVSDIIYDKKSINDLVICRLCSCAAKVTGGDKIILLCEKVPKDDIKVRFFELRNNELYWEDFGEFQQTDVHKSAAITFKTPRYINPDVNHKVQVFIQLFRPSDGETSEPLQFEFYPDPGMRTFPLIQRKLKRQKDMEIFQQILSLDSETTATKYSAPTQADAGDNDNENDDTVTSDSSASKPLSSDTLNDGDEKRKTHEKSYDHDNKDCDEDDDNDDTDNYNYIECANGDMEIEFPVPQITFPSTDDSTQTSTPVEEFLGDREINSRALTTVDKITKWINSNEFERTDSLIVENGDMVSLSGASDMIKSVGVTSQDTISLTDDTRMNTELIEQDIELDDKYCLELLAKRNRADQLQGDYSRYLADDVENLNCSASAQVSVDLDENFDETATYTSLQIALKNPIEIASDYLTMQTQGQNSIKKKNSQGNVEDDLVIITNPPAPRIKVNVAQTPQTPPSPPLPLPPRTPSPIGEQILPPLPPKRKPSQELWIGVNTNSSPCHTANSSSNGSISSRPPSQIIIMRTPDQSPTKRSANSTPSPKKKQGFFSRLFSRKKSKADASASGDESNSKATTPNQSREPSIGNFSMNDNNRSSIRSAKSLQPNFLGVDPKSNELSQRAVGRSASSVSGKRPAQRNADVIHIPLKGDSTETLLRKQERSYSSSCALRYDGGLLDRKTLSALQLADIPISDGNMELIAIADRQSIKNLCEGAFGVVLDPNVDLSEAEHFALYTSLPTQCNDTNNENVFSNQPVLTPEEVAMRLAAANDNIKRKRIKTGGNPMNLLREIQQLEQNQMQCNIANSTNMDTPTMWNIQPSMQSPSTFPEVKAEPYLSPNYYGGSYRNTYQTSPSPQPTSPMMNRNILTPSPGLLRNSSAESQTQMANVYNQSQINQEQYQNLTNNFNLSTSITCNQPQGVTNNEYNSNIFITTNTLYENSNNNNFNMTSPNEQQTLFGASNMLVNRTSGGSFTPIYANSNANGSNNNNITHNNLQQVQAVLGTANNMIFNQFQDPNVTADSSLFNLSQLDDLVPLQNSDELRISNLSIST